MNVQTMRIESYELGVVTSYSRPRVSNDSPFAKSLFKTCKYHPNWPTDGFNSLEDARLWVLKFTHWYNMKHKHSQLCFVTPNERHTGEDKVILAKRRQTIEAAKTINPAWLGHTRSKKLYAS